MYIGRISRERVEFARDNVSSFEMMRSHRFFHRALLSAHRALLSVHRALLSVHRENFARESRICSR